MKSASNILDSVIPLCSGQTTHLSRMVRTNTSRSYNLVGHFAGFEESTYTSLELCGQCDGQGAFQQAPGSKPSVPCRVRSFSPSSLTILLASSESSGRT